MENPGAGGRRKEGGELGAQRVLDPGCVSLGGRVSPAPPILPRRDENHPFASARVRDTFPKWPIRHPVSGSSALIKDICTGLTLLPGQRSCSRERL